MSNKVVNCKLLSLVSLRILLMFSTADGRRFLIEGIYRRLQGDDAAGYVMKEESVLRMGIAADL